MNRRKKVYIDNATMWQFVKRKASLVQLAMVNIVLQGVPSVEQS